MLDENFNRFKRPSNVHIQHVFDYSPFILLFSKMAAYKGAVVMVLTEFVDSEDEKPRRGKKENGSKGGEKVATSKTYFRS